MYFILTLQYTIFSRYLCDTSIIMSCLLHLFLRQAVEHFLTSLNQQKQSEGPQGKQSVTSNNIWTTMRMAISLMGKPDLYQACDNRDIDTLNQHFGMQA